MPKCKCGHTLNEHTTDGNGVQGCLLMWCGCKIYRPDITQEEELATLRAKVEALEAEVARLRVQLAERKIENEALAGRNFNLTAQLARREADNSRLKEALSGLLNTSSCEYDNAETCMYCEQSITRDHAPDCEYQVAVNKAQAALAEGGAA